MNFVLIPLIRSIVQMDGMNGTFWRGLREGLNPFNQVNCSDMLPILRNKFLLTRVLIPLIRSIVQIGEMGMGIQCYEYSES